MPRISSHASFIFFVSPLYAVHLNITECCVICVLVVISLDENALYTLK